MFTKQHYEAIAKIIKRNQCWKCFDLNCVDNNRLYYIICELANYFKKDNPNFDREKFLKACGIED